MRVVNSMSTKDKILAGALALFNAEGFAPTSALDVATALGLSPGHLYYHFRGKAEIAAALFALHEAEMGIILAAMEGAVAHKGADRRAVAQTYVHILLEEMEDHRFIYREFAGLMRAHAGLALGLTRLAQAQRKSLTGGLKGLVPTEALAATAQAIQLGLWALPGQLELIAGEADPRARAALGAGQLMGLIGLLAGPAGNDRPGKRGKKSKV